MTLSHLQVTLIFAQSDKLLDASDGWSLAEESDEDGRDGQLVASDWQLITGG
ncbi:MAG TPA: hypothetical protein VGO68_03525 [Pyrinomonadaceae bacterium]|nr:hypothetical protein [Pyrinomonadaceae bacterium]